MMFVPMWFIITAEFFIPWPLNLILGIMMTIFAIPGIIIRRRTP